MSTNPSRMLRCQHSLLRNLVPKRNAKRNFHASSHEQALPLFHLAALSNSREAQWFTKASGLSPVEHIPNLEIIRSSEVHPYSPNRRPVGVVRSGKHALASSVFPGHRSRSTPMLSRSDANALSVGRQVLHRNAQELARAKRALRQTKRTQEKEKLALQAEVKRLSIENKSAAAGILLAIGVATFAVTWSTWPSKRATEAQLSGPAVPHTLLKSASPVEASPFPAAAATSLQSAARGRSTTVDTTAVAPTATAAPLARLVGSDMSKQWSWRSWFWKDA
ncbi:hypothetical protein LTR50_004287 [Elasticomyces elasticus]|nr:hypothetical protein LTR50_004287 [Elasticomyces elasticus]